MVPEIIVCGQPRASELLRSDPSIRHVVSIRDPDREPPEGLHEHGARKLHLLFHDVERPDEGYVMPTRADVETLVQFLAGVDGSTLIHCAAGVSRSTAATYILLCMILGPDREDAALDHLATLTTGRIVMPNRLLVYLADELLGRNGAMMRAHRTRFCTWFAHEEFP